MAKTLVLKGTNFSVNKIETITFGETIPCTEILLSDSTKLFSTLGSTETLTATLTPSDTTDVLLWSSSDSTVVSVVDGVITALKVGEAIITATCGNQTATCSVSVYVVPDYVVEGAFNARAASSHTALAGNTSHTTNLQKYGTIAGSNSDTSVRAVDRSNENDGDYRFVPIQIPEGAARIKIQSKMYSGQTLLTLKTRFIWFDSTKSPSGYTGAYQVGGVTGDSNWDQDTLAESVIVTIPDYSGLDSFALAIWLSDYALQYNRDDSQYFDVVFLPSESA